MFLLPKVFEDFKRYSFLGIFTATIMLFAIAYGIVHSWFDGVLLTVIRTMSGIVGTWIVLSIFQIAFNRESNAARFFVDASLTIYLTHIVFVFFFSELLIDRLGSPLLEWATISIASLVLSVLFYMLSRRIPLLHFLLNGKFYSSAGSAAETGTAPFAARLRWLKMAIRRPA